VDDVEVARGHDRLPHLPLACLGGGLTRLGGAGRGLPAEAAPDAPESAADAPDPRPASAAAAFRLPATVEPRRGTAASSSRVYSSCGSRQGRSREEGTTRWRRNITASRAARSATTPILWVLSTTAVPVSPRS